MLLMLVKLKRSQHLVSSIAFRDIRIPARFKDKAADRVYVSRPDSAPRSGTADHGLPTPLSIAVEIGCGCQVMDRALQRQPKPL
jgi:hypothetical protein